MNYELIECRFAVEKILLPDGYYIGTTESNHPLEGRSYHIEVEQVIGSLCPKIAAICNSYGVTFTITGKGKNALINLN